MVHTADRPSLPDRRPSVVRGQEAGQVAGRRQVHGNPPWCFSASDRLAAHRGAPLVVVDSHDTVMHDRAVARPRFGGLDPCVFRETGRKGSGFDC